MLKFTILNGYKAGEKAGHAVAEYDTTLAEDVREAEKEFNRLLGEGRTALTSDGDAVTRLPQDGEVFFLLPVQGG